MSPVRFKKAAAIRNTWAILMCVAIAGVLLGDIVVAREVEAMRERNPAAHVARALAFHEEDESEAALSELDAAIRLSPDYAEAWLARGSVYVKLGRWDLAADAYRRGIELGDPNPMYRVNLLWCLIELNRYEEAITFGDSSLAAGVRWPDLLRTTAIAYIRVGKLAEATPLLEKALLNFPDDLYLMDQLREAYAKSGDRQKSEAMRTRMEKARARMGEFNSLESAVRSQKSAG